MYSTVLIELAILVRIMHLFNNTRLLVYNNNGRHFILFVSTAVLSSRDIKLGRWHSFYFQNAGHYHIIGMYLYISVWGIYMNTIHSAQITKFFSILHQNRMLSWRHAVNTLLCPVQYCRYSILHTLAQDHKSCHNMLWPSGQASAIIFTAISWNMGIRLS